MRAPLLHVSLIVETWRQTCFLHGNGDTLVPQKESFLMYDELLSRGAHAEMHMFASSETPRE
jgi:hypothetical protein